MLNPWQPSEAGALERPVLRLGGGQVARAGQRSADHDAIEDDADEFEDVLSPRFHNHPASSFQQEGLLKDCPRTD